MLSRVQCRELAEQHAAVAHNHMKLGEDHKARMNASIALAYSNMALDPERPRQ